MDPPPSLDPIATKLLSELARDPAAAEIVLGGYFALQHYGSYRQTHDIDAWWKARPQSAAESAIRRVMQQIADESAWVLLERRFGETTSWELLEGKNRRFSFQIAVRSVQLDEPLVSSWPPIHIETLRDNVGSKMNALVDRGAPRDFTDIYQVVHQHLASRDDCWQWWSLKNPGVSASDAKRKVVFHLCALEARRPLAIILDPAERDRASTVRTWFHQEFLA